MVTLANPVDANQLRLRHEFLSLPGLVLTTTQTARLLDVRVRQAEALLASLEEERFLMRTPSGTFRRAEPPLS